MLATQGRVEGGTAALTLQPDQRTDFPAPPTAGFEEAARRSMRAEGMRVEATLNSLFPSHQEEMKAHQVAMGNTANLATNSQPTNVERIVERIIERDRPRPPPPPPPPAPAPAVPAGPVINFGTYVRNWINLNPTIAP